MNASTFVFLTCTGTATDQAGLLCFQTVPTQESDMQHIVDNVSEQVSKGRGEEQGGGRRGREREGGTKEEREIEGGNGIIMVCVY